MENTFQYFVSIRFKLANKSYNFGTNNETLEYGDFVVVETARGLELGELISPLRPISEYSSKLELKPILRKASSDDRSQHTQNLKDAKEALKKCELEISKLKLDMKLISGEYTLDRNKITFVYVADERVDFRELLKNLAAIFHCRIDLRQIGSRDKAKIVGGIGICGRETCCSKFLEDFDIVSINMAKNQLLALNTQKLSGQCGKLMCCLKFEDEAYKELRKNTPKLNAQVQYEGKRYRLTSMNVISKMCKLENHETSFFVTLDELKAKGEY
ncbi:MAG: regulatory iron-sulfur-containing complex subunit RicT [Erysipelotrichaceae bacterium]